MVAAARSRRHGGPGACGAAPQQPRSASRTAEGHSALYRMSLRARTPALTSGEMELGRPTRRHANSYGSRSQSQTLLARVGGLFSGRSMGAVGEDGALARSATPQTLPAWRLSPALPALSDEYDELLGAEWLLDGPEAAASGQQRAPPASPAAPPAAPWRCLEPTHGAACSRCVPDAVERARSRPRALTLSHAAVSPRPTPPTPAAIASQTQAGSWPRSGSGRCCRVAPSGTTRA